MISAELVVRLRYESEGDALDFKSAQYAFVGASDEQKSELLKDVLAFANSWRRTDAYILIGLQERKGAPAEVVGISSHLDDAQLQQFVNAKTQRPLRFAYATVQVEGKSVAAIHIPMQPRPFYLKNKFGKLEPNTVYVRRGSSTDTASLDEIALMGRRDGPDQDIELDVCFADPESRSRVTPTLKSQVLDVPPRKSIPDYESHDRFQIATRHSRSDYYRELVSFTQVTRRVSPVWFAIANTGTTVALDVRMEISLPGRRDGVLADR